jgi:hypothetical protein
VDVGYDRDPHFSPAVPSCATISPIISHSLKMTPAAKPLVQLSLDWLERVAPTLSAPWSLAWSMLALVAHHRPIHSLEQTLSHLPNLDQIEDISTLALTCLALDRQRALTAFGVAP